MKYKTFTIKSWFMPEFNEACLKNPTAPSTKMVKSGYCTNALDFKNFMGESPKEVEQAIDRFITDVMKCLKVSEAEAIKQIRSIL
jgi:hypothetical protein